ncbi:hypothetical protein FBU59_002894 [Linderina macrospora]|uniref:Uncharacterized protein n=1 Tax=Linderina macrospora TaxID=4868 RepID=A0ACC1JA21_9FUNG|nr:hypothetical protein FBU59_002894 [Linderina macrospora]
MNLLALLSLATTALALLGPQPTSTINADCAKQCSSAPEDQRETCYRICSQFSEQGVAFTPISARYQPSPVLPAAMHPLAPQTMMVGHPMATIDPKSAGKKGKSGEDVDEDGKANKASAKSAAPRVSDAGERVAVGIAAAVAAAVVAAF